MQEKIDEFAEWILSLEHTDKIDGKKKLRELQKQWAEAEKQFDETFAELKKNVAEEEAGEHGVFDRTMTKGMGCFTGLEKASQAWWKYFELYV